MFGVLLTLLLAQQAASPAAPAAPPTPPKRDDGAVLIRLGGQVTDADEARCPRQPGGHTDADEAGRAAPVYSGTPIDLDVEDAELGNVLRLISAVSHMNFVLDDTVKGTVTAHLESVPWDLALAAILQSKGLIAVPYGTNLLLVQPLDR